LDEARQAAVRPTANEDGRRKGGQNGRGKRKTAFPGEGKRKKLLLGGKGGGD